jgi:hypothetical protein
MACPWSNRKPPPKAWGPGTNPITNRSNNTPPANGAVNPPKPAVPVAKGPNAPEKDSNDRLNFLYASLVVRFLQPGFLSLADRLGMSETFG